MQQQWDRNRVESLGQVYKYCNNLFVAVQFCYYIISKIVYSITSWKPTSNRPASQNSPQEMVSTQKMGVELKFLPPLLTPEGVRRGGKNLRVNWRQIYKSATRVKKRWWWDLEKNSFEMAKRWGVNAEIRKEHIKIYNVTNL